MLALAALVGASSLSARAEASGRWLAFGLLAGTSQPDAHLADYQWDTRPRAAWGVKALAGLGPYGAGVRLWQTSATQWLGLADSPSPEVRSTSWELVGEVPVASVRGVRLLATAGVGRLHIGYRPDHGVVATPGGPVEVRLDPIDEWIGGGGAALKGALPGGWDLGLEVDHRVYRLDTAHRDGDAIVERRETFGEWGARLGLAWTTRR